MSGGCARPAQQAIAHQPSVLVASSPGGSSQASKAQPPTFDTIYQLIHHMI
jgi:hypothetical protein